MWDIIRFLMHQSRSSSESRDGLHYQQQATLRNVSSHFSALCRFLVLGWSWRPNTKHSFRRTMPVALLLLLHLGAWSVAGIFVSRLVASSNEVLIQAGACGYWPSIAASYDGYNAATQNAKGVLAGSFSYMTQCYGLDSAFCSNTYSKQALNFTYDISVQCPLGSDTSCLDGDYNFRIDTGLIDSNVDLGINSRPEHSIQYRKVTTCAPTDITPWISGYASDSWTSHFVQGPADWRTGETSIYYYFGPGVNSTAEVSNYTFSVSNYTLNGPQTPYFLKYAFYHYAER